jgi:hypothetical protein
MLLRLLSIAMIAAMAAAVAVPASAEGDRVYKASREVPIKDCTRVNGRWGYYGNLWCTPAEQERWDRWSANRSRLR